MGNRRTRLWFYDLLFLLVLALAGYLRLTGVDWGEGQHQHPDENFFSSVLQALSARECADPAFPVEQCPPEQQRWISIGKYLDNKTSPLSPYNRGYSFYVYGNLPMTLTRIAADIVEPSNLRLFGRQFSALADLFAILFLYLLVSRLYGPRVALLASLFSALTVMQIQQSHFFTGDLFVNTFEFLALWFAVAILEYKEKRIESGEQRLETEEQTLGVETREESVESLENHAENSAPVPQSPRPISTRSVQLLLTNPLFLLSIGFGFALGMAMASKINIAPLAVALPAAFVLRYLIQKKEDGKPIFRDWSLNTDYWTLVTLCLVAGGVATILSFRIFQPYAFEGLGLNPQWVANIREQRLQATGGADVPWELQWARRTHLYSFENLTLWGFGLPLGILAWAGFLYMGWRILKGEWRHALLWGWTAAYFAWQSLQFNPTMRYQLPVYPLLAMMAAWFVYELAGSKVAAFKRSSFRAVAASLLGITVLALTAAWAFAFHSIYLRDEPRMAASRWIYQNIPGPINLQIESSNDGAYNQPVPFPVDGFIQAGQPYDAIFFAQREGALEEITLGHAVNKLADTSTLTLTLSDKPGSDPEQALATATLTSNFDSENDPRGDSYTLTLDEPVILERGSQYYLHMEIDEGVLQITGASVANETTYDYPLPFRVDNYDAFSGIYRGDLTLEVYWDDNLDKLNRFVTFLNDTDYILIPTNHQYAQITRLPERYPLTTLYYRELIGCPADKDIIWCYRVARPGTFEGRLGYDLVAVFETYPTLGPIVINDQAAEEAFTFYDHPKAMIFKKNEDFNIGRLQTILSSVDVTKAVRLNPRQFDDFSTLLLPENKLAKQRAGGTWSELFDYDWVQNRYPVVGLVIWYLFISVLGLA
ncbi:MAG TPA: glycosyltransferase family 39 protein, partial [Anaerolineales bacterium]|nr:glycosyltransferase family 39 protein [Anaerolineales bacterium]